MKNLLLKVMLLPAMLFLLSFDNLPEKIKVFMIGDSTMSVKEVKNYPETGWGMPFSIFFDSTVTIDNRAMNGRSTRTFIEEKRWEPIAQHLKKGDYVFIQFGHNDEISTKKSYTTEQDFRRNLLKFITETRERAAIPVLLTSLARRKFDSTGTLTDTHRLYSDLVRAVAKETQVAFIDLDLQSQELIQKMGPEHSRVLFNYLEKGEHPNYPEGIKDDTHFSELGARKMAEMVLGSIKTLQLGLAGRIVQVKRK